MDKENPQSIQNKKPGETKEAYVKRTLWAKIKLTASKAPFITDAVAMYYAVRDVQTPLWAKATIVAALAYFILPVDTIPDFIPIAGFSDDAAAIAAAMAAVRACITDEHRQKAKDWRLKIHQLGRTGGLLID